MDIDKTVEITGGPLQVLTLEGVDISAVFTVDPFPLLAATVPNTISITSIYMDSTGDLPPVEPPPGDRDYLFYGVSTETFGLGGAPPYIAGYPIGGTATLL